MATTRIISPYSISRIPDIYPYYFNGPNILVLAPTFCLDCTRFGGTTVKPPFWQ